jgi:hypothetical protein
MCKKKRDKTASFLSQDEIVVANSSFSSVDCSFYVDYNDQEDDDMDSELNRLDSVTETIREALDKGKYEE